MRRKERVELRADSEETGRRLPKLMLVKAARGDQAVTSRAVSTSQRQCPLLQARAGNRPEAEPCGVALSAGMAAVAPPTTLLQAGLPPPSSACLMFFGFASLSFFLKKKVTKQSIIPDSMFYYLGSLKSSFLENLCSENS